MSNLGTYWTPPNEYLKSQYAVRVRKPLPSPESLKAKLRKHLDEETNIVTRFLKANNIKNTLKLLSIHPPDRSLLPDYFNLLKSEDRSICRLAHHLVRECTPLADDEYKQLVQILDSEVNQKSSVRRAVALRTLARVIKKRDTKRGLNSAEVALRSIAGVTKQIRISKGLPVKPSAGKNKKKKGDNSEEPDEDSDDEEKIDDGAGNLVYARDIATKIKDQTGKVIMGHTVMACVRRCNKVNPQNFGIEVYFYDLGLRANTPSTVRNTIGLLENRLTANINAVGFYLHPRLPQFNPAADKKLVFEDLGAKIYYARILATLATDPNLEAYVERNATPASQAKAKKGLFGFIFGGDGKSKKKKGNALRNDKLGVDFFEALTILLRNPSGRVLLEVIVGLSRRSWASWIDVPVPSHALYDAPDYDDARLAGDVDIDYDDDSDEEFLQDDKFAKSSNQELQSAFAQPQGPQGPAYLGKKEKRKLAREQQAQLNAPFYLRKLGEGMIPALEVVMRRILGGMVKDDPCLRFGALRAAVAIARAKLYTDTPEEQELLNKAKSEYYGTSALPSTQQQPGAPPQQGVPQQMTRPQGLLPDEGMPTFEDDNQQHVLEPLTKHLVYLLEEEPSLYVRCKSAEAFLLFIAAGAGSSIEDKLEEDEGGEVERQSAGFRDRRIRPGTSFEEDRRNQRGPPLHEQGEERNMVDTGGNPNDVQRDQPRGQPEGPGGPPRGPPLMGPPGTTPEDAKPPPPPPLPPLIRFFRPFLCNERMKGHVALDALQPFLESLIFEVPDVAPWLAIQVVDLLEDCAFYHGTKGWCGYLLEAWENVLAIATIPCAHAVRDSVRRCAEALPERERLSATSAQFLRRRVLDLTVLSVGAGELMAKGVPTPLPQVVGSEMESHFSLIYHGILMGPSPESRQCFVDALGGAAVLANDPFRINAYEKLCELRLARGLGLRAAVDFVLCALDTLYSTRERLAEARLKLREQGGITNRNREEVWLQGVWKLAAEASAAAGSLLATPPPPGWQPLGADAANDVRAAEELLGDFRKFRISGEDPEANLEDHGLMPPERRDMENGNPARDPRMDPRSDQRMDQRGDPRNDQRGDPRAIQQNERVGNGPHPPPGRR